MNIPYGASAEGVRGGGCERGGVRGGGEGRYKDFIHVSVKHTCISLAEQPLRG